MNGITVETEMRSGMVESEVITWGRPPANCAMGCPEHLSEDICWTCYRRPVKWTEYRRRLFRLDQGEQTEVKEGK